MEENKPTTALRSVIDFVLHWTPAELLPWQNPECKTVYRTFQSKRESKNLLPVFATNILIGICVVCFTATGSGLRFSLSSVITGYILNAINIVYHVIVLLLMWCSPAFFNRNKLLITPLSFIVLLLNFSHILLHIATVEVLFAVFLLLLVDSIFYFQSSFVMSLLFWIIIVIFFCVQYIIVLQTLNETTQNIRYQVSRLYSL